METKRIIDINGYTINEPKHYHSALEYARLMIDTMEKENIDRSDMLVILTRLFEDIRFTFTLLKDRK